MSEPPKGGGRPKISVCGIVKRNKPRKISPPGSAVYFCDAEHEALEHTARSSLMMLVQWLRCKL